MALPPELLRTVSREEINALPIRRYEGEVRVVATAHRPGESYPPSLAQLATARAVYLFQVRHRELAAAVAEALASAHIVKAGVSVADDLKALKKVIEFTEKSVVDLGTVATRHGLKQTGVRNMAGLFLGFRIPKGTKTSNWSRPQLTGQQITYAATDAWACRELYLLFRRMELV
jgi:ribonuclease D